MARTGCAVACNLVPRTAIAARPPQQLQVALAGGVGASFGVPRAAVRPSPLEHLQMAVFCCIGTGLLVPSTAIVASSSLENFRFIFLNGDRVCTLGFSYGGYMVNWMNG